MLDSTKFGQNQLFDWFNEPDRVQNKPFSLPFLFYVPFVLLPFWFSLKKQTEKGDGNRKLLEAACVEKRKGRSTYAQTENEARER